MSTSNNPRREHPSTYFVQDRSNEDELTRLQIQSRLFTINQGIICLPLSRAMISRLRLRRHLPQHLQHQRQETGRHRWHMGGMLCLKELLARELKQDTISMCIILLDDPELKRNYA